MGWVWGDASWRLATPTVGLSGQLRAGGGGRIDRADRRSFPVFQFRSLAASIYRRRGCNAGKLKCCNAARQFVGMASCKR